MLPRIPGHEIAGRVDVVASDVTARKVGQRVGVGWHGGHCFQCDACRRGLFINCEKAQLTGLSFDGGYAAPRIAKFKLDEAETAFTKMMKNRVRFRAVLVP